GEHRVGLLWGSTPERAVARMTVVSCDRYRARRDSQRHLLSPCPERSNDSWSRAPLAGEVPGQTTRRREESSMRRASATFNVILTAVATAICAGCESSQATEP